MARPRNPNKLVPLMTVVEPELRARLKDLSARTRVPANAYVREAIGDLLQKYAHELKPQKKPRQQQK
jgi:hypothetical protein